MKVKAYIHLVINSWSPKPTITILGHDASDSEGYELLEVREIDVDMPEDFSPQSMKLRQLEKQKKKVIDDYQSTLAKINDEISKFNCLEMTP